MSFFIWKAAVIDDISIVNYTEYASVDVLPFEVKTRSFSRLHLVLSQIQCSRPPFFDEVLSYYFPFTQNCFFQLNNCTVTELRTCRSCHLSYYLCTVAINAVFFYFPFLQSAVMNIYRKECRPTCKGDRSQ